MAVVFNNNNIHNFYYENHDCDRVYWNDKLVFQKDSLSPFFIELSSGDSVRIYNSVYPVEKTLYYSRDGISWTQWGSQTILSMNTIGYRWYFKSNSTTPFYDSSEGSAVPPFDIRPYPSSTGNGKVKLGGRLISLFNNANIPEFACVEMFRGNVSYQSVIEDISELIFPDSTAAFCYAGMFAGRTGINKLPKLPATSLATRCYYNMFKGCTNIKLSTTQTSEYNKEFRIPSTGTGSASSDSLNDMFLNTGGTFAGTPDINTTYYTNN